MNIKIKSNLKKINDMLEGGQISSYNIVTYEVNQGEKKVVWEGSEAEFNAIAKKDPKVMYIILEDN